MKNILLILLLFFCTNTKVSTQVLLLSKQSQTELTLRVQDLDYGTLEVTEESSESIHTIEINSNNRDNIILSNLKPATIYQCLLKKDNDVLTDQYFITQSQSSGTIKNYFNHDILPGNSNQLKPDGVSFSEVERDIRILINNAKKTIDYCAYNSGISSIVNALIDAQIRGVRVRVVTDNSTSNSALNTNLPFEVIYDTDNGLMHNKFIAIDAEEVMTSYLVTGSMNFTSAQMKTDPNHLMVIQDQALVKAYVKEFEEMWGSSTAIPNKSNAKFGGAKKDNTPHEFTINGISTQLYFSPSDNTSAKIIQKLKSANQTIDLSLLIFTYNELYFQLIDNISDGIKVNGIIDDVSSSSSSIISGLNDAGGKGITDTTSNIFHYKMGLIDADFPSSNPVLITGSHNWTFSAETRNDENTLIFDDGALANLYKRAMYYFWNQWVPTSTEEITIQPSTYNDQIYLHFLDIQKINGYSIFDLKGNKIETKENFEDNKVYISELNPGIYYLLINESLKSDKIKFIKL